MLKLFDKTTLVQHFINPHVLFGPSCSSLLAPTRSSASGDALMAASILEVKCFIRARITANTCGGLTEAGDEEKRQTSGQLEDNQE